MARTRVAGIAAVMAAAAALSGCSGGGNTPIASTPTVTVSATQCAPGWHAPAAGQATWTVNNTGSSPLKVLIVSAQTAAIYGEIFSIAGHASQQLTTVLSRGSYQWRCQPFGGVPGSASSVERVTGSTTLATHPLDPLTSDEAQAAVLAYRQAITSGLRHLTAATRPLAAAVARGDRSAAERLWLPAHLDWARLGAAYDAFGPFTDKIDGRADGLPGGVHSSQFTGFLRLEYGLWHGQPMGQLRAVASQLLGHVEALQRAFPHQRITALDIPLRAHEILENTLQFELTGDTDEGSHTNLATAWANVAGDRVVIGVLTPSLEARSPHLLHQIDGELRHLSAVLLSERRPDGQWTPLQSLSRERHEALDAMFGQVLQNLSRIPDLLQLEGRA